MNSFLSFCHCRYRGISKSKRKRNRRLSLGYVRHWELLVRTVCIDEHVVRCVMSFLRVALVDFWNKDWDTMSTDNPFSYAPIRYLSQANLSKPTPPSKPVGTKHRCITNTGKLQSMQVMVMWSSQLGIWWSNEKGRVGDGNRVCEEEKVSTIGKGIYTWNWK